jgi:hypothetical protein
MVYQKEEAEDCESEFFVSGIFGLDGSCQDQE